MTPEAALAIIAAHGADSSRWPPAPRATILAPRAAILAVAGRSPEVAAALAEAARLDALLSDWATDVTAAVFDLAAITRLPQAMPVRRGPLRWMAGAAIAAAAAALLVLAPRPQATSVATRSPTLATPADGGAAIGSDAEAFAGVFTPTPEEEELI